MSNNSSLKIKGKHLIVIVTVGAFMTGVYSFVNYPTSFTTKNVIRTNSKNAKRTFTQQHSHTEHDLSLRATRKISVPLEVSITSDNQDAPLEPNQQVTLTATVLTHLDPSLITTSWKIPSEILIIDETNLTSQRQGAQTYSITLQAVDLNNYKVHFFATYTDGSTIFSKTAQYNTRLERRTKSAKLTLHSMNKAFINNNIKFGRKKRLRQ